MNKESLKEYLSNRYQGWESFLNNIIFPIFGKDDFEDGYEAELLDSQPERRKLATITGIRSIKQVGKIYVGVEPLQIFDVTVSDRVMMERNRVNIQRLIRTVMDQFSCAFMLFHYEDDTRWDWRFTYCRKSAKKEETTNNKRFTFLLGPGQSCRTAADNFIALYEKRESLEIKNIEEAFNVEALSQEFFGKYKAQYEAFVNYMVDPANGMRQDFIDTHFDHSSMTADKIRDREEKPIRDYVKKLLGRIVFLHFLQKKGWLGVPAGKEWGEGDRDFMLKLFENASPEQKENFLDEVLEGLFANGLDTNRSDNGDVYNTGVQGFCNCRIPYLNGGLFERDALDEKTSRFPAKYFESLLTMLSQYNFTIDENDPNDAEVGVDPEMLGRIFENLLEDNKDKGAFYTPKEIVQYMCRESLIAYLQTDQKEDDKERIRQFVTTHDVDLLGELKEEIEQKLIDVKICDPAIGSGAFPMGLLRELFFCRSAIEPNIVEKAADIKRHIIQNNIYGVDIERGAVEIARLRFWLALIVDEKSPEVLPNLDFKIMQGNSLLEQYKGVDLSAMTKRTVDVGSQLTFFNDMLDVYCKELRDKLAEYYACPEHNKKVELRSEIAELVKQQLIEQHIYIDFEDLDLSANSQFFLWHTWFHDVFSRPSKEGFDIVIGNPPYGAKTSSIDKVCFKEKFTSAKTIPNIQKGSLDTFSLFIELGHQILHIGGNAIFIVPLSVTASDAMSGLHRLLINHCDEIYVSSYGDRPRRIFENAEQQVSIIGFKKSSNKATRIMTTHINKRYSDESLWLLLNNLKFVNTLHHIRNGRIPKVGNEIELVILSKLERCVTTIKDVYQREGLSIYYRKAGGRYYKIITKIPTYSSAEGELKVNSKYQNLVGAALSSNLFYWFWLIHSDWHNLRSSELEMFPIPFDSFSDEELDKVNTLYNVYLNDLYSKSQTTKTGLKCFFARQSKKHIDAIDKFIGEKYGLSEIEINFLINYDHQYRSEE
jgi:DNA modification methylase